jgi:hypothetical protein
MSRGCNHITNTIDGFTTVILEVEDNIHMNDIPMVRKELESISIGNKIIYESPLHIINKHDEDISFGWKFVILSDRNIGCINSVIDDIADILQ